MVAHSLSGIVKDVEATTFRNWDEHQENLQEMRKAAANAGLHSWAWTLQLAETIMFQHQSDQNRQVS